jgi:hypothetical protein
LKPVFDGRNNLYTRDPLPIGNDRVELEVKYLLLCSVLLQAFFCFSFESNGNPKFVL